MTRPPSSHCNRFAYPWTPCRLRSHHKRWPRQVRTDPHYNECTPWRTSRRCPQHTLCTRSRGCCPRPLCQPCNQCTHAHRRWCRTYPAGIHRRRRPLCTLCSDHCRRLRIRWRTGSTGSHGQRQTCRRHTTCTQSRLRCRNTCPPCSWHNSLIQLRKTHRQSSHRKTSGRRWKPCPPRSQRTKPSLPSPRTSLRRTMCMGCLRRSPDPLYRPHSPCMP